MRSVTEIILSGSTWTAPPGVLRCDVHAFAPSGDPAGAGSGSGGGAYSYKAGVTFPQGPVDIQIGAAGSETDTWFKSAGDVLAKAGENSPTASVPGTGGDAASGVGDVKFSGGDGGDRGTTTGTNVGRGGGMGGQAGPNGDGGDGGDGVATEFGGGGAGRMAAIQAAAAPAPAHKARAATIGTARAVVSHRAARVRMAAVVQAAGATRKWQPVMAAWKSCSLIPAPGQTTAQALVQPAAAVAVSRV